MFVISLLSNKFDNDVELRWRSRTPPPLWTELKINFPCPISTFSHFFCFSSFSSSTYDKIQNFNLRGRCLHTKTTFWKSLVWIFHLYLFFSFWDHVKHHNIIDRLFQTKETWCDQKQSANGYIGQRLVRFGQSSPFLAVLWDILALIRRDHTLTRPTRAFSDALASYPSRIHGRSRRSYLFVM